MVSVPPPDDPAPDTGMPLVSLVMGVGSIVTAFIGCMPGLILALGLGAAAIATGLLARGQANSTAALGGIVVGTIGVIGAIAIGIVGR